MRRPIGVVGAIAPFNFPLNLVAHKVAPAIAAGCPVVLKPASQTPFSSIELAKLLVDDCGLPPEWLHVVIGSGSTVGNAIVDHPDIALDHVHRLTRGRLGHPVPGRPQAGRARARQQRAGHHRARQRLVRRGDEDPRRRVLPRRSELHLDPAGARASVDHRRVHRLARQGGVDARGRRSARRGDRGVGADLDVRARPGQVVDRRCGGRRRDDRVRRRDRRRRRPRADGAHERHARHGGVPQRGVRAGRGGRRVRHARRGDPHRQRQPLRAPGRDLHEPARPTR